MYEPQPNKSVKLYQNGRNIIIPKCWDIKEKDNKLTFYSRVDYHNYNMKQHEILESMIDLKEIGISNPVIIEFKRGNWPGCFVKAHLEYFKKYEIREK